MNLAPGVELSDGGCRTSYARTRALSRAHVVQADLCQLPFAEGTFDFAYSYGVLHHSPNTQTAIEEVHRVLKPGGTARIMIYHTHCWVGFLLWTVHCLGGFRPWKSARWAIYNFLESPGTKAYTKDEARAMFSSFSQTSIRTQLSHGDLLALGPYQRHTRWHHKLALALYPRWAIRLLGNRLGMAMLIEAEK